MWLVVILIADAGVVSLGGGGRSHVPILLNSTIISGDSSPGASLCLGLGATESAAAGCACAGCVSDGAGNSHSGHILH